MTVHDGNTVPCPKDKRAEAGENGQAGKMDRLLILDDHSTMTVISGQNTLNFCQIKAQELCESRGDRPGLPVPNSPYDLCGRKATLNLNLSEHSTREKRITCLKSLAHRQLQILHLSGWE